MLKITSEEMPPNGVTLRLEGSVVGPWVAELQSSADGILARRRRLVLDLTCVDFLDREAVALIRRLAVSHVDIAVAPGFVAEQLKGA